MARYTRDTRLRCKRHGTNVFGRRGGCTRAGRALRNARDVESAEARDRVALDEISDGRYLAISIARRAAGEREPLFLRKQLPPTFCASLLQRHQQYRDRPSVRSIVTA